MPARPDPCSNCRRLRRACRFDIKGGEACTRCSEKQISCSGSTPKTRRACASCKRNRVRCIWEAGYLSCRRCLALGSSTCPIPHRSEKNRSIFMSGPLPQVSNHLLHIQGLAEHGQSCLQLLASSWRPSLSMVQDDSPLSVIIQNTNAVAALKWRGMIASHDVDRLGRPRPRGIVIKSIDAIPIEDWLSEGKARPSYQDGWFVDLLMETWKLAGATRHFRRLAPDSLLQYMSCIRALALMSPLNLQQSTMETMQLCCSYVVHLAVLADRQGRLESIQRRLLFSGARQVILAEGNISVRAGVPSLIPASLFSHIWKGLSTEALPPSASPLCSFVWHDILFHDMSQVQQLLKALPDVSRVDFASYRTALDTLTSSFSLVSSFIASTTSELISQYGSCDVEAVLRDLLLAELLVIKLDASLSIRKQQSAAIIDLTDLGRSEPNGPEFGQVMIHLVEVLSRSMRKASSQNLLQIYDTFDAAATIVLLCQTDFEQFFSAADAESKDTLRKWSKVVSFWRGDAPNLHGSI